MSRLRPGRRRTPRPPRSRPRRRQFGIQRRRPPGQRRPPPVQYMPPAPAAPVQQAPPPPKGSILGPIGAAVGNAFLPGLGGALGGAAGNLIGSWIGFSKKNVKRMVRHLEAGGSIRFPYRELLLELQSSITFVNQPFALNPGDVNTFPFMSQLAKYFTEYTFEMLKTRFVSQSADALNSTNTALGSVHMATNYNSLEPAFTSEAQVLVTPGVTCSKPSIDAEHYIDVMPRNGRETLYVRSSAVYSNADERLDDLGLLQISTAGMQAVADIGKVWIEYDCTLRKPRLTEAGSVTAGSFAHIVAAASGTATAAAPLGTTGGNVLTTSNIPVVATSTNFTLPYQGYFSLSLVWQGSGIAAVPALSYGANIAGQNVLNNNGSPLIACFGSTTASILATVYVDIPGTGAANTVTISGLTSMTGANADVIISAMPGNYSLVRRPVTEARLLQMLGEFRRDLEAKSLLVVDQPDAEETKLPSPRVRSSARANAR